MNWFNKLNKTGKGGVISIAGFYFWMVIFSFFHEPLVPVVVSITAAALIAVCTVFIMKLLNGDFNE